MTHEKLADEFWDRCLACTTYPELCDKHEPSSVAAFFVPERNQ